VSTKPTTLALAVVGFIAGLSGAIAGAAPASAQESPAAPIVTALRQSPVYVDRR